MIRTMGSQIGIVLFFLTAVFIEGIPADAQEKSQPRLGINLAGPCDWNTELPFVDVFHLSRQWISQKKGSSWGQGPALELDEQGWVKCLQPDCWAETPLCTIEGGHYPNGTYTVLYDGDGRLDFGGAGKISTNAPGQIEVDVQSSKGSIFLKIMETNPANYVRNIRVIMPGYLKSYASNPWHPLFLKRWSGVSCFRFMDWMETNDSKITHWQDRPHRDDATYTTHGIPLEWMIDLCNRQHADAWFCMPHLADDDYIRQFALMVREQLDSQRKIYIEYSNEVWNGSFPQNQYAAAQGQKRGLAEKAWEAAWCYTAYRSMQIFQIWEEVFGGHERFIRVLPTQAANSYVSEQILKFQDAGHHADALAIAPYLSMIISTDSKPGAAEVETWNLDQIFDYLNSKVLPQTTQWITDQKKVADQYGLKLIAYEGGQHLVGNGDAVNRNALTRLFQDANRDLRMGKLYDQYYQTWEKSDGDLFAYFSSVSQWSKWGSWGILEFYDEDPAQSPKFLSTLHWANHLGHDMHIPSGEKLVPDPKK